MKSVLLCTPCYDGRVEVPFANNLVQLASQAQQMNYEFDWLCTSGDSNVCRARNNTVATFMNSSFETLAFVDSDIDLHPNDFWRLAAMEEPIRGAAVATKTEDGSEKLSCWSEGTQITRDSMPAEPFEVDYLGSAVLFIDRSVFEALAANLPVYYDHTTGQMSFPWFENQVIDDVYLSEDYGFCLNARKEGFRIYCEPKAVVTHYGKAWWRY